MHAAATATALRRAEAATGEDGDVGGALGYAAVEQSWTAEHRQAARCECVQQRCSFVVWQLGCDRRYQMGLRDLVGGCAIRGEHDDASAAMAMQQVADDGVFVLVVGRASSRFVPRPQRRALSWIIASLSHEAREPGGATDRDEAIEGAQEVVPRRVVARAQLGRHRHVDAFATRFVASFVVAHQQRSELFRPRVEVTVRRRLGEAEPQQRCALADELVEQRGRRAVESIDGERVVATAEPVHLAACCVRGHHRGHVLGVVGCLRELLLPAMCGGAVGRDEQDRSAGLVV